MFQGDDKREFWERVEERNRAIAKQYRKLGLADYPRPLNPVELSPVTNPDVPNSEKPAMVELSSHDVCVHSTSLFIPEESTSNPPQTSLNLYEPLVM